jgi:hypothetical protein
MLCKISGFHGGHYEECRLLGCDAVWLFTRATRRRYSSVIKLFVCLINYALCHEGVWGNECIDPYFLDLGTSWRRVLHRPAVIREVTIRDSAVDRQIVSTFGSGRVNWEIGVKTGHLICHATYITHIASITTSNRTRAQTQEVCGHNIIHNRSHNT